jgi:hypothetical protein
VLQAFTIFAVIIASQSPLEDCIRDVRSAPPDASDGTSPLHPLALDQMKALCSSLQRSLLLLGPITRAGHPILQPGQVAHDDALIHVRLPAFPRRQRSIDVHLQLRNGAWRVQTSYRFIGNAMLGDKTTWREGAAVLDVVEAMFPGATPGIIKNGDCYVVYVGDHPPAPDCSSILILSRDLSVLRRSMQNPEGFGGCQSSRGTVVH